MIIQDIILELYAECDNSANNISRKLILYTIRLIIRGRKRCITVLSNSKTDLIKPEVYWKSTCKYF